MRKEWPLWRRICLTLSVLLLLSAAALTAWIVYTDHQGGAAAERIAAALAEAEASGAAEASADESGAVPTLPVDGAEYIGLLEIPALGLRLPIAAEWSAAQAKSSPCRYTGSAYDGSLVLAGHNYQSHFGRLGSLQEGDTVRFTDVEGTVFEYTVSYFESIDMYDIDAMQAGEWDLALFTCDASRVRRVTVRCTEVSRTPAEPADA